MVVKMEQINIFEALYGQYKIPKNKTIRLIELFAGIGAQAKALENLGVDFEKYRIVEFDPKAVESYNAIHHTDFIPMDITKVHAQDLAIREREKNEYIMCYSFPCQDLSLAGKGRGMTKGTGTRSGLLWEVERILNECGQELPQILVMENVPQVIGKNNIEDFKKWELYLESKGYSNYIKCLNSKHYGIPQNRNRCFMVSILGDAYYEFPRKTKLKLTLEDMLEENVDEKYYLSSKQLDAISGCNAYEKPLEKMDKIDKVSPTITTRTSEYTSSMILIKNATKKGYLEAEIGDGIDISTRMETHRGTVQKGKAQTITTMGGENVGVVVSGAMRGRYDENGKIKQHLELKEEQTSNTITTVQKDNVVVVGNYSPSGHNASRIVDTKGLAPTVMENHGTVTAIVDDTFKNREPREYTETCPTLRVQGGGFKVKQTKVVGGFGKIGSTGQYHQQNRIYDGDVANSITTDFNPYYVDKRNLKQQLCDQMIENGQVKKGDVINHSYSKSRMDNPRSNNSVERELSPAMTTRSDTLGVAVEQENNLAIRKLTPCECLRLMGFSDDDYKAVRFQSDACLYKQAGNSIVVNVLMAIFKQLL